MSKDWRDVTDDELLNFEESNTAKISRYDRISRQRAIAAISDAATKIQGLAGTLYKAGQNIKTKMDEQAALVQKLAEAQSKQQKALILLTGVIAVCTLLYTFITGYSVATMREANRIQQEFLELKQREELRNVPAVRAPTSESETQLEQIKMKD